MLRGIFGGVTGTPYIEGSVLIPGLAKPTDILFLVDTGADMTMLLPQDSDKIGIDFGALLGPLERSTGIGGVARIKTLPATVLFTDPGRAVYGYEVVLSILEPSEAIREMPSLLGQDVLRRWRMTHSPPTNRLSFSVYSADYSFPL